MVNPIYLQKALKYNPEKHTDIRGWGIQRKLDGVRVQIAIDEYGEVRIFSRSIIKDTGDFNEYTYHLPHVVQEVRMLGLTETILDGEACIFAFADDDDNFRYVSGALNMLVDGSLERQREQYMINVVLFDAPLLQKPYEQRYDFLMENIPDDLEYLFVNDMTTNWRDEYLTEFNRIVEEGGEGIILYNLQGMYKHSPKRVQTSKEILKIKDVNEKEVLVVGKENGLPGKKYQDGLGALVCVDGRGKRFRVGTGFGDELRDCLYHLKTPFVIEIKYHSETAESIRLPVFYR